MARTAGFALLVIAMVLMLAYRPMRTSAQAQEPLRDGGVALTKPVGTGPQTTTTNDPISAGGGEFRERWRLLSQGGLIPLDFTLIYAPDLQFKTPANNGWTQFPPGYTNAAFTSNTVIRIVEFEDLAVNPPQAYIYVFLSDDTLVFRDAGGGNFVPLGPVKYQIRRIGDAFAAIYLLMDPVRELVYIFRMSPMGWSMAGARFRVGGEVMLILDRNNNSLSYTYNQDNNPTRIEDGLGRRLDLTYINNANN